MTLPIDVYVRVSRRGPREDERFHSPEEQEQLARAFAESRGLRVGVVLPPDIDKSGGTVEREGLKRALERVRAGESGGIVVAWLDRFSRDAAQAYDLLRAFEDAGGRVYAPEAPEDVSTPEGTLQMGMFLLFAQYQRQRARAGFDRAKERATLAGIPFRPVPIGYRQRADRKLEVDPETAPAVREVFERRAAGDGWTKLANVLGERTDRVWTRQGVEGIIRRRLYATGRLEHGDVVSEHDAGAIVDEPLWHAAQRVSAKPRPARNPGTPWLLSGLLKCATCGYNLTPRRTGNGYRRYQCQNRRCAARASVVAERLERWVMLQSFAAGDEMETRAQAPDLEALETALATAERRLEQATTPEAQDALGELWAPTVKTRRQERDAALAQLGAARQAAGAPTGDFRLHGVWEDLSSADKREALALFWKAIIVGRKTEEGTPVTFVARGPGGEAGIVLPNSTTKGERDGTAGQAP